MPGEALRAAGAAGRSQQDLARQRVAAGLAVPGRALRVFEVREARDGSATEQEPAAYGHLAVSIAGSSALSQSQHSLVGRLCSGVSVVGCMAR